MALDIYVWLAQRLHRVSATKPQIITWKALEDQFGGTYANPRKFRQNFRERLQLVLKFYQDAKIEETWHGVYPKLPGKTDFVKEVEPGVWVVNGLSGAGMTMSFGLASELV